MKKYFTSRREAGFTLIELVIVIAIAALILAAVLVFVPTVQKNRRDGERKNNIGKLASTVESYVSDNGGTYPTLAQLQTRITADNSIKDPNSGANITTATGSCPGSATAVGTYYYQAPTGAVSYEVCTYLESKSVSTN